MNSVLILGASGLLGQALVERFARQNIRVGALSRYAYANYPSHVVNHEVDVLDASALAPVIAEYDLIINCIGQITYPIEHCLSLNTQGMTNISLAINKFEKKFIHISSVSVYGQADEVDESSPLNPQTAYASIKCFAEYIVRQAIPSATILRICNLYGETQQKGIINYLSKTYLAHDTALHFNNDGGLNRYYLYINDLVDVIYKLSSITNQGTFNVISNSQLTIIQLIQMFEDLLKYSFDVKYSKQPAIENIQMINNHKISRLLPEIQTDSLKNFILGLNK